MYVPLSLQGTRRRSRHGFGLVLAALVVACGGGGPDSGAPVNAAGTGSPGVVPGIALDEGVVRRSAVAAETWTMLAWENQTFTVTGTRTVRYGANDAWITKTVSGTVPCTNAFFGSDPVRGIGKVCQLSSVVPDTAPPPVELSWRTIAWENQPFSVSGTQAVRYGTDAAWITKTVTGSGTCSNAFFGSDPAVGVGKICQLGTPVTAPPPPPPPPPTSTDTTWRTIAWENQPFSVSGTQTVRYGTDAAWITKTVTGSGTCSNAFFGSDPAVGVGKVCQLAGPAPPPTPPAPPPPTDAGTAWETIALENQPFSVAGTQTVRFGTDATWISRSVTGSGTCSNAFFGADPAVGRGKACQVAIVPAPPPAPVRSGVGINLDTPTYWQSDWPFINEFKRAGGWSTSCRTWETPSSCLNFVPGASANDTRELDKVTWDADGYPLRLPAMDDPAVKYRVLSALVFQGNGGTHAAGRWIVLYDGEGALEYHGVGRKVENESRPGRDVVEVTNSSPGDGMQIQLSRTSEANHLRNIRVIGPGGICTAAPGTWVSGPAACTAGDFRSLEALSATQAIHPAFVGDLTGMRAVRFATWSRVNESRITGWAQRGRLSDAMWTSGQKGVPYEAIFELSRLTGADPWVNVPAWVDDDFVRQLARLARSSLAPSATLYYEYGNEGWNSAPPWGDAGVLFEEQARIKWPGSTLPVWQQRLNWYAYRMVQMCRLVKAEFGVEASRVKCVANSQAANAEVSRVLLACELARPELGDSCGRQVDALGIAPYFGHYLGDFSLRPTMEAWAGEGEAGMDKLFRELTGRDAAGNVVPAPLGLDWTPRGGALSSTEFWIRSSKAVADEYGLPLVAYEGGQHLQVFGNARIEAMFHAANRHPRMGAAMRQLVDAWKAAGGQMFLPMSYTQLPTGGSFWGMKEHQRDDAAPKWQALAAMRDEPCWWTLGCRP